MYLYQRCSKVFQVDGQSCLNATTTSDNIFALQDSLDHAQGVVDRALHFVTVVVIGTSQNDGTCCPGLGSSYKINKKKKKKLVLSNYINFKDDK